MAGTKRERPTSPASGAAVDAETAVPSLDKDEQQPRTETFIDEPMTATTTTNSATAKSSKRQRRRPDSGGPYPPQNRGPPKQSKLAQFADERKAPAEFIIENGLRKVRPYWFIHRVYAKGRWIGRKIYDVYSTEFRDQTPEYYMNAILAGKIAVDGRRVSPEYIVGHGDLLSHAKHRHEPPISADKIGIVFKSDDFMVLDKPASMPVHATGRYHHNTVVGVLSSPEYGFDLDGLFPANRLDRLTSGILLMALTKDKAVELMHTLSDREVEKRYLCRVRGEFPDGKILCEEPIKTLSHVFTTSIVAPDGKPCTTEFTKLSYNGRTSLLECKPLTGRTHQIRVHLQYLGYPIANDPLYCTDAWGSQMGKGGAFDGSPDDVVQRLKDTCFPYDTDERARELHNATTIALLKATDAAAKHAAAVTAATDPAGRPVDDQRPSAVPGETVSESEMPCLDCHIARVDPIPDQLRIYLHSWMYVINGVTYKTDMPDWARDDYDGDSVLEDRFWRFGGRWDGRNPGNLAD